jgi:hypothetical protein
MADLSICIAHKHTPANDKALRIALDCIIDNTRCDYELLVDTTTPADPYGVYNKLVRQSMTPYCVLTNSDVFMAPGWDIPYLEAANEQTILTGVLVEPKAIGVSPQNKEANFGMRPDTFNRHAFEVWAETAPMLKGKGWYMPCLMPRDKFLDLGGFDTSGVFMKDPVDKWFWAAWEASGGNVQRVYSVAYHLQNWSNPVEQEKGVRQ